MSKFLAVWQIWDQIFTLSSCPTFSLWRQGVSFYGGVLSELMQLCVRPFDTDLYEDEGDEDEILDEEGRARLKLKVCSTGLMTMSDVHWSLQVENTIRWRYSQDESGNDIRESNARLVKWSDGTMSLYLGSEIFDIHRQPLQGEFSHLFVRQGLSD